MSEPKVPIDVNQATGVWSTEAPLPLGGRGGRQFEPRMVRAEATDRLGEWRRAVQRALHWVD